MTGRDLSQAVWRKSRFSEGNGGDCVEVAFLKSSFSEPNGGACVEVAHLDSAVALRDSKNPTGPVLVVPAAEWRAFLGGVVAGEFPAP